MKDIVKVVNSDGSQTSKSDKLVRIRQFKKSNARNWESLSFVSKLLLNAHLTCNHEHLWSNYKYTNAIKILIGTRDCPFIMEA